ncbi:hypothetical protein ACIHCX_03240 [Streptomyces sp. NPDC052043]|uniref:hypothetical protein n=1 Tax=Streptomyces sp. NPDC052043 TaxID=3365684 RepID=UPI0037D4EF41
MRSDDILTQIDQALDDWTVSDDAMRSRPAVDVPAERGPETSVQIMDEAGEWQEIPGIGSVEIQMDEPPIPDDFAEKWARLSKRIARAEAERARHVRAVLEAFREAVKPVAEEAGRTLAELAARTARAAEHARADDYALAPPRPARLAIPYGPARRRH